jgi:hypothetical protein
MSRDRIFTISNTQCVTAATSLVQEVTEAPCGPGRCGAAVPALCVVCLASHGHLPSTSYWCSREQVSHRLDYDSSRNLALQALSNRGRCA